MTTQIEDTNKSQVSQSDILENCVQSLEINQIQRHIFLCADQTKPKCCAKTTSLEAWDYLKKRLKRIRFGQNYRRTS